MRVTLTVTEGPHQGRVFTFAEHDTFIVGRSKRAHFRLPFKDKYFSRHHFLVEVNPPHCRLLDLGSKNGTFVNDGLVTAADLHDGDVIRGGHTVLRAALAETAASLPATVSFQPPTVTVSSRKYPVAGAAACPVCGAASGPQPPLCAGCEGSAAKQPQPIAGYRIVRELGRGGMGVVHAALGLADGRAVALKTIVPQSAGTQEQVGRFLREADILRELDHPHIVAFHDMGELKGRFYFAMDYVRGTDGSRLLKAEPGGLPIGRAVDWVCQLLKALEYAHAKQLVHRDIKPSNLLVVRARDRSGALRDVVQLADFGLARVYQATTFSGLTLKGQYAGTFPFMPPEQITHFRESRPTGGTLYAAGATLYNLLTGRFVYDFPAAMERKVLMLLQDEPIPIQTRRRELPADLATAIHRALAREPSERFPSAQAMHEALAVHR